MADHAQRRGCEAMRSPNESETTPATIAKGTDKIITISIAGDTATDRTEEPSSDHAHSYINTEQLRQYGTHSLRRTKASIIYKATGNLRAVQILLGHTKIENTVRYLGVDVEDALTLAEGTEI